MPRGSRLVGILWRWHRRLGVVAAVFVLVLAVTGILLNHSPELGLDRRFIDAPWLSRLYGDTAGDSPAYRVGGHWLFRAANGSVYVDTREAAPCKGTLVGALAAADMLVAACEEELLLLTPRGDLLESISAATGLPVPLSAVGAAGPRVVIGTAEGWRLADIDALDFSQPVPAGLSVSQLTPGELPAAVRAQIPAPAQWLSWERLLQDVHSGRVAGRAGVWLVDGIGVLLALLSLSGLAIWWLHRWRRHRSPSNR